MQKKSLVTALVLVAAIAGGWQLFGQKPAGIEQDRLKQLKPVMQRKLDHSKALLEGLATEDFKKVAKSAQSLSLLSLESSWNVMVTEEYLKQSNAFRRSLESIRDGANEKNVDRATLGYVDMTIRCIECHKYVRRHKGAVIERAAGE